MTQPHIESVAQPYWQPSNHGPACSTPRVSRVRERRFAMGYEDRSEPPELTALAAAAKAVFLEREPECPAMARAAALRRVVEHGPLTIEADDLFLGGADPFFFNLLLPSLQSDAYARGGPYFPDPATRDLAEASAFYAVCFEGHITPGLEFILGQGVSGLRWRLTETLEGLDVGHSAEAAWCRAALHSCDSLLLYAARYREAARAAADCSANAERAAELRSLAGLLERVPEHPAQTLHQALQSYWLAYVLVTVEMGGCGPGGGLGLGRLDQFLLPYYQADLAAGRLTRAAALELMELFLLCFRHVDYYTPHQVYTPGSQASLGGVTSSGQEASNELTELIMEASLRIAMPTPYISLRLHAAAPERYWQAAASYVAGGLGFSLVNDQVLIPAFLRHGRSLGDARDYICSCCYENTIPGREAFHPNTAYLNLPLVLELALNGGRRLRDGAQLGVETPAELPDFESVWEAFETQLDYVCGKLAALVHAADMAHREQRRYPLMSLFIEDCVARAADVCAGGARYNLTGCIVAGLPNVVNSLAAIRHWVFAQRQLAMDQLQAALRADFAGHEPIRAQLLAAPRWGNGDNRVDELAGQVTGRLYRWFRTRRNARGGRWQLALYSFVANHGLGAAVGASADGRQAGALLTRNLNPEWGTDRQGPTAVLESLSRIDFTQFPNGSSLDLRFDPEVFGTAAGRRLLTHFLKGFVDLGVMQMQLSMVDTASLLEAREHPERWPHLMVKVAGYSARFVDLTDQEQEEVINRTLQRLGEGEL